MHWQDKTTLLNHIFWIYKRDCKCMVLFCKWLKMIGRNIYSWTCLKNHNLSLWKRMNISTLSMRTLDNT
jgi:hypothetical protein